MPCIHKITSKIKWALGGTRTPGSVSRMTSPTLGGPCPSLYAANIEKRKANGLLELAGSFTLPKTLA